jgi:hypothetical protein
LEAILVCPRHESDSSSSLDKALAWSRTGFAAALFSYSAGIPAMPARPRAAFFGFELVNEKHT